MTDEGLSPDEIFSALSNRRRRYVIQYLLERDAPIGLKELSAQIAGKENDVPVEEVSHKQRKRTYVALRQNHLPKLKEMGIVDYDHSMEGIVLLDRADCFDTYLNPGRPDRTSRMEVHIGLTVVGILLFLVVWSDVSPLSSLSASVYPTFVVALLIVITLKYYRARSTRPASERPP